MSRSDPDHPSGPVTAHEVRTLLASAARHDGIEPLSERFRMQLGTPGAVRVAASRDAAGALAAYGSRLADGTIEFVVAPAERRRGHGTAVLRTLLRAGDGTRATVWAHGNLPPARAFATHHGLVPIRELHKMGRRLDPADAQAPVTFPDGFRLASFTAGDEDAWLAVNAAAFASHPEQGRVDRAALSALMAEDWFDPGDLLMLWGPDGALAGSHWTKVDPAERVDGRPAGEVYVLAIAPTWHGHGLAAALTTAGLRHLAERGLAAVVLYVDADNGPALATYRRLGFATITTDAQYAAG